jgi:hypothetical protein
MSRLSAALLLAAVLAAVPSPSQAAPAGGLAPPGGSVAVWGILGYGDAVGVGARYRTALVPEGFIRSSTVHDSLDLEGGFDYINWYGYGSAPYDYGYNMFVPCVGVMWSLWVAPEVALYPKLDLGFAIGSYHGTYPPTGRRHFDGLRVDAGAGVIWRFRRTLSLRGEIGSVGLRLGLGFDF